MDLREMTELLDDVLARLLPRLEEHPALDQYVFSIRSAHKAGEWQLALENLIGVLADEHIRVSAAEHRDLKRLLDDFATDGSPDSRESAQESMADLAKIIIG